MAHYQADRAFSITVRSLSVTVRILRDGTEIDRFAATEPSNHLECDILGAGGLLSLILRRAF